MKNYWLDKEDWRDDELNIRIVLDNTRYYVSEIDLNTEVQYGHTNQYQTRPLPEC